MYVWFGYSKQSNLNEQLSRLYLPRELRYFCKPSYVFKENGFLLRAVADGLLAGSRTQNMHVASDVTNDETSNVRHQLQLVSHETWTRNGAEFFFIVCVLSIGNVKLLLQYVKSVQTPFMSVRAANYLQIPYMRSDISRTDNVDSFIALINCCVQPRVCRILSRR